jgi:hypothetical protein
VSPQGFFEIKIEITVSRRQISRKLFSRLEKSVFEINDFSVRNVKTFKIFSLEFNLMNEHIDREI